MLDFLVVRLMITVLVLWLLLIATLMVIAWRKKRWLQCCKRIALVHGILLALAAGFLVDVRPTVTTPLLTTEDKVMLRQSAQRTDPNGPYHLRLTGDEIARGLRSAADIVHGTVHSRWNLPANDRFDGTFSIGLGGLYLNAEFAGIARIEQGVLDWSLDRCRFGRLPLPGFAAWALGSAIGTYIESEPVLAKGLKSVQQVRIEPDQVSVAWVPQREWARSIAVGFQREESAENLSRAVDVVRAWLATQGQTSPKTASMTKVTQDLLGLTRQATSEWSAVRQNRVLLLAGGVMLGHPRFLVFTGQSLSREEATILMRASNGVQIHGRNDLVRHFWVSAALAELSTSRLSLLVGISKEEMDSGSGGSGFSFADLQADRAGIRFAERAVAGAAQAADFQRAISTATDLELVPSIDGLPEGIPKNEFLEVYGGTQGAKYKEWVREIDRRLNTSRLLKKP